MSPDLEEENGDEAGSPVAAATSQPALMTVGEDSVIRIWVEVTVGPMLGPAQGSSLGRPALPQQPAGPAAPGGGSGGARLQAPPGKGEPRWAEVLYTSLHPSGSGATSPSCRRCRAKGAQVSRDAVHFLGGIQQWSKEEPRWAQALCTTLYTSGSGARGFKLQVWPAKGVRVGVAAVQLLEGQPLAPQLDAAGPDVVAHSLWYASSAGICLAA